MRIKVYLAGILVAAMAGLVGGSVSAWLLPARVASAQAAELPPIFHVGADLLSPMGRVQIREMQGPWIRVKSLHPLASNDTDNQWMYVPSLAGTWIPSDSATIKSSQ